MKKIFFAPVFALLLLANFSCQKDDSLDPRPIIVSGQYVRLDITNKRLNYDDIANTRFGGSITTPGGNVAKYNLYVRKNDIYGFSTDFKLVKTITSFPATLEVSPQDIATALDVPLASLVFGDTFRFYGESFSSTGNRVDFYSLSTTVQSTSSMKQGYRFVTDMTNTAGVSSSELAGFDNYTSQ